MSDDTNGIPPPPQHPSTYATMKDIERLIDRLSPHKNTIENTESVLKDVMPRLERLEGQFNTFNTIWTDSIDTRKKQLDRIEDDIDGYSDKIDALDSKLETSITYQVSNDEAIRAMKIRYDRDLYGGTVKDGDTIIPGLMSTVKYMSEAILKQNEILRLIERRLESEEQLTARWKAREQLITSSAVKALPLALKLLVGIGGATGIGAALTVILKILGG